MRLLLAGLVLVGCLGTNRATLDETAALFHDDLRWGRLPAAETSVDARARAAFQQHHRGWGAAVRVVDLDVDAIRTASVTGMLRVRVTWISGHDSTDVRESIVEEHWESAGGNWRLVREAVVSGDPSLFPAPPEAPATAPAAAPATAPATAPAAAPAPASPPAPAPAEKRRA